MFDPFARIPDFDLEARIRDRAARCAVELSAAAVSGLAEQARAVLRENDTLHLTTIVEPAEFVERHLGEAFEGAAMLPADLVGPLLDLGSGNGYPGLPLAAARPGLELVMAEASRRKADFLRAVLREADGAVSGSVLDAQVQRASDLEGFDPFRLVASRAMGGWAKILPRLLGALADDGEMLVWAGEEMADVSRRVVWRKLECVERRPLPGREQSWIWRFRRT